MIRNCPLCESERRVPLSRIGWQTVSRCEQCGMVYASESQPIDYAKSIYSHREYAGQCRKTAERIAQLYPGRNTSIVEIGCARGWLLEELRSLGFTNLAGVDPDVGCCEDVRRKGFAAIHAELPIAVPTDLVVLSHVVEHLWEPLDALHLLHNDLYIEVPDAARYTETFFQPYLDFNQEHVNHFTLGHLGRLGMMVDGGSDTIKLANGKPYPVIWGLFRRGNIEQYVRLSDSKLKAIDVVLDAKLGSDYVLWGGGQFSRVLRSLPALRTRTLRQIIDRNPMLGETELRSDAPIVVASMVHKQSILNDIQAKGISNPVVTL